MSLVEVKVDKGTLEKAERLLAGVPNGIRQAAVSSLNRALMEGRTTGTREATKRYTLKAGIIRKTMVMSRANKRFFCAYLKSRGKRLPLKYYAHKPGHDTTGSKRKQVTVGVRQGSLHPVRNGFIYLGMIMQRLGASPYPIEQSYSLSVPNILNHDEIKEAIQNKMVESVERRMAHETERILSGYGL